MTTRSTLPEHVTMPLLTLITQQSLDVDYVQVADRRTAEDEPGSDHRIRRGTAVAVAIFGLLITTAAVQTIRNEPVTQSSRAALIDNINRRTTQAKEQQAELSRLHSELAAAQAAYDALASDEQAAQARLTRLQVPTGFTAVHGPGVRIEVDDSPDGSDAGRVRDEDLATLVDGLWNAGAEAISINGQRLTVLSSIRTSGVAIHVNFRPISPPYEVLAIGDTRSLQSRLADSTHGLRWLSLVQTFGFEFHMDNEDDVVIPGARLPVLRDAAVDTTVNETLGKQVAP
ncbi:MAG TPA: DUF881 domain-containing protein [Nocardioides sp.]